MTEKNMSTYVAMVVDRSGSMERIRDDTIGGINTFLEDQKKDPEGILFTYAQFDDYYEVVYDSMPIIEVPAITRETFQPRGMTALLDAIGKTINRVSSYIAVQDDADKPQKVVLVIVTDGHENSSREFKPDAILELIESKQNNEDWQIVYLAANQNAIKEAQAYGIRGTTVMNYTSGPIGVGNAYIACSNAIKTSRTTGGSIVFSEQDRYCSTADSAAAQQTAKEQWTAAGIDVHPVDVVAGGSVAVSTTAENVGGQVSQTVIQSNSVEDDKSS